MIGTVVWLVIVAWLLLRRTFAIVLPVVLLLTLLWPAIVARRDRRSSPSPPTPRCDYDPTRRPVMTTPSPITRGRETDPLRQTSAYALSLRLAPRYVIVDVGTYPLPDVEPDGEGHYPDGAWDVKTAGDAVEAVHHGLAVMQAIHDRDTAPKRHSLDGLGVGSIAHNISAGDDWRLRADGLWVPLDDDQQDEDYERTTAEMVDGDWVIRHRETATDPSSAPRVYRVGDVIASNAEPEPPRTAVLLDRDGDKTRCVDGLWTVSGGGGASWSHRAWFPMTVVSL